MTLINVLKDLKSKEIKLWVEGESLQVDAPNGALTADLREQIKAHEPEIIQILGRAKRKKGIERVPRDRPLPLSYAQEGVWYLEQLAPGGTSHNMSAVWSISGQIDVPALEQAIKKLTARHETLRTAFVTIDDQPQLAIRPTVPIDFSGLDLRTLSQNERHHEFERLIKLEKATPFDLSQAPLFRTRIYQIGDDEFILQFLMHHIIGDAWSFGLMFKEIGAIYVGDRPLPSLPVQYADFASWQRKKLEQDSGQADLTFWTNQLGDAPPLLELPTDFQRPAVLDYAGDTIRATLPPHLAEKLSDLNKSENVTPFMVLLTVFKMLLQRYAGQDDIVVGTPMVNRDRLEIENLIGFFLNNLALRSDLAGNPTFRELVLRIRETTLNAYSHQAVPFEKIVQVLDPPRDLSYTPIFQTFFNMVTTKMEPDLDLKGTSVDLYIPENSAAESKFDFTLYLDQSESQIKLRLVYKTSLFRRERMAQLLDQYIFLVEQALERPDTPIQEFSILTPQVRTLLPDPTTALSDAWMGPVYDALTRQAQATPNKIAVCDPVLSWRYAELETQSNRLAHYLIEQGVRPGDVVAIFGHRSAPLVWAWMGILKAGAAFVNLDPAYPAERLQHYVDVAQPTALITIPAAGDLPPTLNTFAQSAKCTLSLSSPEQFATYLATPPDITVGADDTAYVAFTSGSTGKPKGVRGRHGSLSHFLPWQTEKFSLSTADRFSMLSGLSHDPLQRDIFTAFWAGGSLHIPDPQKIGEPGYLSGWMENEQITFAHMTPPLSQILTESTTAGTSLDNLRYVFFVGDKLTRQDVGQLQAIAPNVTAINSYGSTETQRAVGYHLIPPNAVDPGKIPAEKAVYPLGRGMPGVQLLVLNDQHQLAGIGESGEIYVRSPHLAGGYLGDGSLSAERFIPNPFTQGEADRLYRTGDLGRYRPDGLVEFAGRADRQFKVRGFRVEPGEIEAAIADHAVVKDAIVIAVHGQTEWSNTLAAYYTTTSADLLDSSELRNLVSGKLPDHMVPATFTHLASVPLTPNGKIDYRALPQPAQSAELADGAFTEATGDTEKRLAAIWKELLELDQVSVNDSFFALGGHSLLAIRLFNQISETFGTRLPLTSLFQYPSISQLAIIIDFSGTEGDEVQLPISNSLLIPIQPAGNDSNRPFFCVHGFGGGVVGYGELARLLGPDQPFYGLQAAGNDGQDEPDDQIEVMAARYIETIREVQPDGPYRLGGYCYGGVIAYEMARQLKAQGERIETVAIFEGYAPLRGSNREVIWTSPRLMAHWLRNLPYWFSDFIHLGRKQIRMRMRRRTKRLWGHVAPLLGRRVSIKPEDIVDDTNHLADYQLELMKVHLQALRNYDPADIYDGRVTLFRVRSQALSRTSDPTMGWNKLATAVNVKLIKGSHNNILEQPHVPSLAASLKENLR